MADRFGTGEIDAGVVQEAIDLASGLIDRYVSRRYRIPLAQENAIRKIAVDLAWYELQKTAPTEAAQKNRDDAIRFLKDVASGLIDLGPGQARADASAGIGLPEIQSAGRVFDRSTSSDFI